MKKLLLGIALCTVGCSNQSLTGPSETRSSSATSSAATGTNAPQGGSSAAADDSAEATTPSTGASPTVQYAIEGPRGCVNARTGAMRWDLAVGDSGPSALRFVALTHQSPDPGCDSTIEEPRDRVRVSGHANYPPHSAGLTLFTFDPSLYSCGRVQVDVSAFDATGRETLLVGMVVNYGKVCPPPPPPPPPPPSEARLECASQTQKVTVNQLINLTAKGGTGTFAWQAPAGSPETGNGASFATSYTSAGPHTVTVASGHQKATCTLLVETQPPPPALLMCAPATQNALTGASVVLTATGGTGTYAWSTTTGSPSTGQGASFTTSFVQTGTHSVVLASGTATTTCAVTVSAPPPPPTCEAINLPTFVAGFPGTVAGRLVPLIGTAEVKNQGVWQLVLYATSSIDEYEASQPDYVKATASQALACGETTFLQVDYPWMTHPAKYWWIELTRNGVRVFKSSVEVNPTAP